jgi:hypothetical protein
MPLRQIATVEYTSLAGTIFDGRATRKDALTLAAPWGGGPSAGVRIVASSCPLARMFVSFFSLVRFTSRSLSREYSPTIMPS